MYNLQDLDILEMLYNHGKSLRRTANGENKDIIEIFLEQQHQILKQAIMQAIMKDTEKDVKKYVQTATKDIKADMIQKIDKAVSEELREGMQNILK